MGTFVIDTYVVTYENGITQQLNLVDADLYKRIVPELRSDDKRIVANAKNKIKNMFGDVFFLTFSPLHLSIESGVMVLPLHQGGNQNVTFTKK